MKRSIFVVMTVALFAVAFVFTCVPYARGEAIKLTYSNFFPPTHIQSQLADAWCKEVEKRTHGEVKVEYYPGQTLTKAQQCYDGVVSGLSDIGMSVLGYTKGRFPVMEVCDLPLGYPNGHVATALVNAVYEKFRPTELSDTVVMYLTAHGPGILHTKGKAVRKMEDIKGLKIRSHGTSAKVVQALGGTQVAMPMPETYQSLQKGVVDGAVYPLEANKGWKLGEVIDFCTRNISSSYTTAFFVVMNKDKWNSLSPKIQQTIQEINTEWIAKHGEAWDNSDEEGLELLKSLNHEMIEQDAAEAQRWQEAVQPVLKEYIDAMKEKGLPGAEALTYAQETLKEMK
ncbi:MAG: TRAP transporter substrate-binding protein [Deltaproteobacteria bacterium]|nr:TRAP transporter substrate-binding protein [Deltaproteobacteria bacterium]